MDPCGTWASTCSSSGCSGHRSSVVWVHGLSSRPTLQAPAWRESWPSIWAAPTTITGSIGIYAGKFNLSGLYEKIGFTYYGDVENLDGNGRTVVEQGMFYEIVPGACRFDGSGCS